MQDRIDPSSWPTERGPWPPVTDNSRIYDPGTFWCLQRNGHPSTYGDYPDSDRHYPFDECQTAALFLEDVRAELTGPALDLAVYAAQPFQFGRPKDSEVAGRGRLVLDVCELTTGNGRFRLSLSQGEALLLCTHIRQLVGFINSYGTPSTP